MKKIKNFERKFCFFVGMTFLILSLATHYSCFTFGFLSGIGIAGWMALLDKGIEMRYKTRIDKFQFTIGVTEGYFHNNENANIDFIKLVDRCARETENMFGIYISFNIAPTITLYKSEWGCPDGGEKTYTLTAIRNPMFNDDSDKWKHCCTNVASRLKIALNQTTVTGEFSEVDIEYWK